ncbi:unnamed protein product, partial [Ectocarpus sp. 13 AM-2016]
GGRGVLRYGACRYQGAREHAEHRRGPISLESSSRTRGPQQQHLHQHPSGWTKSFKNVFNKSSGR